MLFTTFLHQSQTVTLVRVQTRSSLHTGKVDWLVKALFYRKVEVDGYIASVTCSFIISTLEELTHL